MVLLFVPAFPAALWLYPDFDLKDIELAVHDDDRSNANRELVNAFVGLENFQPSSPPMCRASDQNVNQHGDVRAVW